MKLLPYILDDYAQRFGSHLSLPEYRQVELYTKKKKLAFADPVASADSVEAAALAPNIAFLLLESFFQSENPELEAKGSWDLYQALPRSMPGQKLIAEIYRILRIYHLATTQKNGHVAMDDGILRTGVTFNRVALMLNVTPAGIKLLQSAAFYYLHSLSSPYGDAYVALMMQQYFADIVTEVKSFNDEDRVLFQFQKPRHFSRHFRLDCDNPKHDVQESQFIIHTGPNYANTAIYPIDFYVEYDSKMHIIPTEALTDGALPLADLVKWRIRSQGLFLPAAFRARFGREVMIPGLPMT